MGVAKAEGRPCPLQTTHRPDPLGSRPLTKETKESKEGDPTERRRVGMRASRRPQSFARAVAQPLTRSLTVIFARADPRGLVVLRGAGVGWKGEEDALAVVELVKGIYSSVNQSEGPEELGA